MTETDPDAPLASFARFTSGDPGLSRCACPATSSSEVGRIRTANGVDPLKRPGPDDAAWGVMLNRVCGSSD
jgi:hypothetical protein